jgi:hypothetical protein
MTYKFESGPIRPPSEASSVLLRMTRSCPWNRCAFCHSYENLKFSIRTVEEIKSDIDAMHFIAEQILEITEKTGVAPHLPILHKLALEHDIDLRCAELISYWLSFGMKSLFLQDADSLVMKTPDIVSILKYMLEKFPSIKRITTYARARTVHSKSPEDLAAIRAAGLKRIHIGMESGCDEALKLVNKGIDHTVQISAGKKAVAAGFELSEYFMPGIGGTEFTKENALETASVINQINPHFIRLRSTVPLPGTALYDMMTAGTWHPVTEEGKIREIKTFLSALDGVTSHISSDHIMNLIEDIEGKLPAERSAMIAAADRFLDMPIEDREMYILGRRAGRFRRLSDYKPTAELRKMRDTVLSQFGSVDAAVLEILKNYV